MNNGKNFAILLPVNTSRSNRYHFYFGLILLLFYVLSAPPAKSQNANERDIQLPGPVNPETLSLYLTGGSSEELKEDNQPVIKGYGEGIFQVGELLYRSDFKNQDEWVPQIEKTGAEAEFRIDFRDGFLEVIMPGRGATIWNKNKFSGNVAIMYKVKAPSTYVDELGIVVRDINTFWHASDPVIPDAIFDHDKYTGAFHSYHKQQGYYASIGGRDNTTTRFRRYPRIRDGEAMQHISLSDKDGLDEYLIQPDQTHTIQLVVYNDIIQYIVDGKVYYEIQEGDRVSVSNDDGTPDEMIYTEEQFSPYNEGWFGFRLVNSHHLYSDFRVYRLEPVNK